MLRATVIANPVASQFTGGSHRDVMAILNQHFEVDAVWPGSGPASSEAAREAVAAGAAVVIAMGGDGMVHHVAQGLIGTEVALGLIPVGTTNVISRILHIPSNPSKAARLVVDNRDPVPIGTVELKLTRGTVVSTHHSLFACGLGLDADVVVEADKDPYKKYRFGSLHYATTAFRIALSSFPKKAADIQVMSEDRTADVSAVLLQFRDVYTYFGKLALAISKNKPDPITALLVEGVKRRRVPTIAARVFTRRDLGELREMEAWESVNQLSAVAAKPVAAQADGESLGMVDRADARWVPDSIRVVQGHPSP